MCVLPQPAVLCCGSSWYDLSDEDTGIISYVRVISPTGYTEAQTRVTLNTNTHTLMFMQKCCDMIKELKTRDVSNPLQRDLLIFNVSVHPVHLRQRETRERHSAICSGKTSFISVFIH